MLNLRLCPLKHNPFSLNSLVNKVEENEYDVHPKKASSRFIFIDYTNMYKY
ncbi:hypothetical protein TYRP_001451 [Tyrophagus putrescentiae]|nr:hypothetical protein TYRP_001451 [Tyrophagus putrescentiae]